MLDAAKVLRSTHVLSAAKVLCPTHVLGATEVLGTTDMAPAEATHMTAAHVSATHVSATHVSAAAHMPSSATMPATSTMSTTVAVKLRSGGENDGQAGSNGNAGRADHGQSSSQKAAFVKCGVTYCIRSRDGRASKFVRRLAIF